MKLCSAADAGSATKSRSFSRRPGLLCGFFSVEPGPQQSAPRLSNSVIRGAMSLIKSKAAELKVNSALPAPAELGRTDPSRRFAAQPSRTVLDQLDAETQRLYEEAAIAA